MLLSTFPHRRNNAQSVVAGFSSILFLIAVQYFHIQIHEFEYFLLKKCFKTFNHSSVVGLYATYEHIGFMYFIHSDITG